MRRKKYLFRMGVPAIVLTFMVIGFVLTSAGCVSMKAVSDGVEYVPATWVMREAEEVLYAITTKSLWTDKEGGPTQFGGTYREADLHDGVTIREYAENAGAKAGVWYTFTAPERTAEFFYAYKDEGRRQAPWIAYRMDPDRASDKVNIVLGKPFIDKKPERVNEPPILGYLPIWVIAETTNVPLPNSVEKVTASENSFKDGLLITQKNISESVKGVLYFCDLLSIGLSHEVDFSNENGKWYICTSTGKPGEIFYVHVFFRQVSNSGGGVSASVFNYEVYQKK